MNPHQKNKIDISTLTPEEQRLFRLYGKLPSRSDHLAKHLKERKYFDSGDYAMSKAGKGDSVDTGSVGSQHPVPENIPHFNSNSPGGNNPGHSASTPHLHPHHGSVQGGSPIKESSFLNRETSAEGVGAAKEKAAAGGGEAPKEGGVAEGAAASAGQPQAPGSVIPIRS